MLPKQPQPLQVTCCICLCMDCFAHTIAHTYCICLFMERVAHTTPHTCCDDGFLLACCCQLVTGYACSLASVQPCVSRS